MGKNNKPMAEHNSFHLYVQWKSIKSKVVFFSCWILIPRFNVLFSKGKLYINIKTRVIKEIRKVYAKGHIFLACNIWIKLQQTLDDQFSSVQSCPTLCDPINCSTPGLPVHHQLPEFTQTHVHRVSDTIQPSHPLSSPSPPAPNPSQDQGLFQ